MKNKLMMKIKSERLDWADCNAMFFFNTSWVGIFRSFYVLSIFHTKEEKPAIGAREPGARLLGGLYKVLCWLGGLELCWEGVGVRLSLGLKRLPWPWGWP